MTGVLIYHFNFVSLVVDVVLPEIQPNAKVQILVSTDEQYD